MQCAECRAAFGIDLYAPIRHAGRNGLLLRNVPMRDFDVDDQRRRLDGAVVCLARKLHNSAGRAF